jgi:hypothetical protein
MELSELAGGDVASIATELTRDSFLIVRIDIVRGDGLQAVVTLSEVAHLRIDGPVEFIDEIEVRRLPRFGPWPAEAGHLLAHHGNASEMVWIRLGGPMEIEILACDMAVRWDLPAAGDLARPL